MGWTGTILEVSPRAQVWRDVFGDACVPILSPIARPGQLPDGTPADFYFVDTAALSAEQRRRVVAHLVERFGLPEAEVVEGLADPRHGLPILAGDVVVPLPLRFFAGGDDEGEGDEGDMDDTRADSLDRDDAGDGP